MLIPDYEQTCRTKSDKAIESLKSELSTLRAGRANVHMLDKVVVDYYGTPTPVAQMSAVSVPDPRTIMIQPWDASSLKAIEKAIQASDLGINPVNDGKCIRLGLPQLTEERRKDLVKLSAKYGEECKVAIRNIRRDVLEKMKKGEKAGELTEDDVKNGEKSIQKIVDEKIKAVDVVIKDKEKEIMTV